MVDTEGTSRAALVELMADGSSRVVLVEEIMRKDIGRAPSGERFLLTRRSDGGTDRESYDALLSKMVNASVQVRMVSAAAPARIGVFVMRFKRSCGQQVFWSLIDLYEVLSLTSYAKQASKWVFHCAPSWGRFLSLSFPGRLILMSKHSNISQARLEEVQWWGRSLPQSAVATVGLLSLLARWAFARPEKGGLREETPRKCAGTVLCLLVDQAYQSERSPACRLDFERS